MAFHRKAFLFHTTSLYTKWKGEVTTLTQKTKEKELNKNPSPQPPRSTQNAMNKALELSQQPKYLKSIVPSVTQKSAFGLVDRLRVVGTVYDPINQTAKIAETASDPFGIAGKAFKIPGVLEATTYVEENSVIKKIQELTFGKRSYEDNNIVGPDTDLFKVPTYLKRFFGLNSDDTAMAELFGSPIHKAEINLTTHLESMSKTHTYEATDKTFVPKSSKGQTVPLDELEQAFGTLDIIKNVTEEEIVDFLGHLIRYPMLALEHKIGKLIRKNIRGMTTTVRLSGSCYRCRVRPESEVLPWTEPEMWQAPTGVSQQGRFNPTGIGLVYISREKETAIAEMKQSNGAIIDVIKLNFEEKATLKIIDITRSDVPLFRLCMAKATNQPLKKSYLLPNFLAQCCSMEGIHAIKYKSVYHPEVSNYVFFDFLREWFKYDSSSSVKIENKN